MWMVCVSPHAYMLLLTVSAGRGQMVHSISMTMSEALAQGPLEPTSLFVRYYPVTMTIPVHFGQLMTFRPHIERVCRLNRRRYSVDEWKSLLRSSGWRMISGNACHGFWSLCLFVTTTKTNGWCRATSHWYTMYPSLSHLSLLLSRMFCSRSRSTSDHLL